MGFPSRICFEYSVSDITPKIYIFFIFFKLGANYNEIPGLEIAKINRKMRKKRSVHSEYWRASSLVNKLNLIILNQPFSLAVNANQFRTYLFSVIPFNLFASSNNWEIVLTINVADLWNNTEVSYIKSILFSLIPGPHFRWLSTRTVTSRASSSSRSNLISWHSAHAQKSE